MRFGIYPVLYPLPWSPLITQNVSTLALSAENHSVSPFSFSLKRTNVTVSLVMSSVPQRSPLSSPASSHRPRANTYLAQTMLPPACSFSTPRAQDYLPFNLRIEFEMIVRPKANKFPTDELLPDNLPFDDTSRAELRRYSPFLRYLVANVLTRHGMPCNVFEPDSEEAPDYTKWNVMLDASVSNKHMVPEHFCESCQKLLSIHSN